MGITLFYRGALRDVHQLPQLMAQIEAACGRLQWPYQVIDERILGTAERHRTIEIETDDGIPTSTFEIDLAPVDDHLRGIMIGPPRCDTLSFTFGRTGRLIDYRPVPLQDDQPGRYGLIRETLWTKTQFSHRRCTSRCASCCASSNRTWPSGKSSTRATTGASGTCRLAGHLGEIRGPPGDTDRSGSAARPSRCCRRRSSSQRSAGSRQAHTGHPPGVAPGVGCQRGGQLTFAMAPDRMV